MTGVQTCALPISAGSTAIGPSGWALFPLTTGNHGIGAAVAIYGGGLLVSYVACFLITWFFGLTESILEEFDGVDTPDPEPASV